MKLKWSQHALNNIRLIEQHIALDNPVAAKRVIKTVFAITQDILEFPLLGKAGIRKNTRERLVGKYPYRIVYRIASGSISILTVVHTSQEWLQQV